MSVSTVGRATTAARGAGRVLREREDVSRAEDNVEAIATQIADLEAQLAADIAALDAQAAATAPLQTIDVRPKKADITVTLVTLAWAPHWTAGGTTTPAWT
jgi:Flp pilus assembly protein TadG